MLPGFCYVTAYINENANKKQVLKIWIGFIWLKIGLNVTLFDHDKEYLSPANGCHQLNNLEIKIVNK